MANETMNLKEACAYTNLSAGVLRKATEEFKNTSKLHGYNAAEPVTGLPFTRNEQGHLVFEVEDLNVFKTRERRNTGPRGEGKAWKVWLTPQQKADINALIPDLKWEDPYAYNRKYQASKRAEKAEKNVE